MVAGFHASVSCHRRQILCRPAWLLFVAGIVKDIIVKIRVCSLQVTLTQDAKQQWAQLDPQLRQVVQQRLSDLADGMWRLAQQGPANTSSSSNGDNTQQGGAAAAGVFGVTQRHQLGAGMLKDQQGEGRGDMRLKLQRLGRVKAHTTTFLKVRFQYNSQWLCCACCWVLVSLLVNLI
jgi:hypothetical protein